MAATNAVADAAPRRSTFSMPARRPSEGLATAKTRISITALDAWYGGVHAVRGATIEIPDRRVTAMIGPSGCGKSTFLRCLNRMHETISGARAQGRVMLDGRDLYAPGVNPAAVRKLIGMVFQRPTPFPTMSIRENVAAGLRVVGDKPPGRAETEAIVEKALRRAVLWDEVKDRLGEPATGLSGGQQQRLCIARALATGPQVLLLDEPTAALDPISTQSVEELVWELRSDVTVVIVTHNMQQAARVSDRTAFFLHGELVEHAETEQLFTAPKDHRTESYLTGRFG